MPEEKEEMMIIGKFEQFIKELKDGTQTSLVRNAFKHFWIFKCPHCQAELILYNAMRKKEVAPAPPAPEPKPEPEPEPKPEPAVEVKKKRTYKKREKKKVKVKKIKNTPPAPKPTAKEKFETKVGDRGKRILAAIKAGKIWYSDIANASGISPNSLGAYLGPLVKKGLIERVGQGKYALPGKVKKKTIEEPEEKEEEIPKRSGRQTVEEAIEEEKDEDEEFEKEFQGREDE